MISIQTKCLKTGYVEAVWVVHEGYICSDPILERVAGVGYHRPASEWEWCFRNWRAVPLGGTTVHDRKEIYEQLWEHTDRLGILQKTQLELADELGLPYQRLSMIFSEFQKSGLMKKYRHKFQMKNPANVREDEFRKFGQVP